jgi:hypothetical protein
MKTDDERPISPWGSDRGPEPVAPAADSTKVRTLTIRPQSPEGRRDASLHSQLPITQKPGATIAPNPDSLVVHTIGKPTRSAPQ